jgi:hypothetical protein
MAGLDEGSVHDWSTRVAEVRGEILAAVASGGLGRPTTVRDQVLLSAAIELGSALATLASLPTLDLIEEEATDPDATVLAPMGPDGYEAGDEPDPIDAISTEVPFDGPLVEEVLAEEGEGQPDDAGDKDAEDTQDEEPERGADREDGSRPQAEGTSPKMERTIVMPTPEEAPRQKKGRKKKPSL